MEGLTENIFASPGIRVALPRFFQISDSGGAFYFKMDTKKCTKCDTAKPLDEFYKNKSRKDGHQHKCKVCNKRHYEKNKDARAEYYRTNKADRCEYRKQYYHANKPDMVQKVVGYARERRANDPLFRLTHNIRGLIGNSFRRGGFSKKSKTAEIIGCSFDEFHQHIESQFTDGMSWDLMGDIHIDHRLPLSAATTEAELLVLNHHRNLQPMWATDNLAKSDSYCPKEMAAYFKKHLPN